MTAVTPNIARPLGLPRLAPVRSDTTTAGDDVVTRPAARAGRPSSHEELRALAGEVAASIAELPEDSPEAGRRAQVLIEALAPIVRIPEGNASVEDRATVSLREVQVLLRWLGRLDEVAHPQAIGAIVRIRSGLAAA